MILRVDAGRWIRIFFVWTTIALINILVIIIQIIILQANTGSRFLELRLAIIQKLTIWYIWAGLSLLVFRMAKKFPINKNTIPKNLPINLASSIFLSMLHGFLTYSIITTIHFMTSGNLVLVSGHIRRMISVYFFMNILIYFMILFFFSANSVFQPLVKSQMKISKSNFLQSRIGSEKNNHCPDTTSYMQRLLIKTKQRIIPLDVNSIQRIEVTGSYLDIYTDERQYLYRASLREMTENLDPDKFMRISRSCMVNVESIKELEKYFNGRYLVVLKNGAKLKVSSRFNPYVISRLIK